MMEEIDGRWKTSEYYNKLCEMKREQCNDLLNVQRVVQPLHVHVVQKLKYQCQIALIT